MPTTDILDATDLSDLGAVIGPASATDGAIARFDTTTGKLLKNSTTADIKTLLSITNVEDKSSATIRGEISSGNVTTALGFTPENAANRAIANGYAPLDASAKVATTYLPDAVLGSVSYQGAWNASTNSPTIPAAATGNKGHYYVVTVAGSTALDGITDWALGDWAISNGTAWEKVDNTDAVISVAGLTGVISASSLRTAMSLVPGTDVQPQDPELTAIAGLTSAADKVPYFTGSGTAAVADFTAAGRALVDDADAAAQRTTLDAEQLGVSRGYRAYTSNDTLVLTDAGKLVASNMAGANTMTVPPNSSVAFAVGTIINFAQYGAGQTTVTAGAGVTIRSEGAKLKTNAQYAGGTIQKIGTDEWWAFGSLAT